MPSQLLTVTVTVSEDGLEVFIGTTAGEGLTWTSIELETYPCFFPLTKMDPDLILISVLLILDCIRDHLSFSRIAYFCFSSGDMRFYNGLYLSHKGCLSEESFARMGADRQTNIQTYKQTWKQFQ